MLSALKTDKEYETIKWIIMMNQNTLKNDRSNKDCICSEYFCTVFNFEMQKGRILLNDIVY
jgi:hypothetical protein